MDLSARFPLVYFFRPQAAPSRFAVSPSQDPPPAGELPMNASRTRLSRQRGLVLLLVLLCAVAAATAARADSGRLGNPGYVIISAALDTTGQYAWQRGPGPQERSLTWPGGLLVLPDSLEVESLRGVDLAIPCTSELAGLGDSGALVFEDGIFGVSEPLTLSDGRIRLFVSAGELEIKGQRIRYTAPMPRGRDPRAGYVFLAGMVLLVVVLLRRAAQRSRRAR